MRTVFDHHQLKVARDSMKKNCAGLKILGGPNHFEAASIIHQLTGQIVGIDTDCTCKHGKEPNWSRKDNR